MTLATTVAPSACPRNHVARRAGVATRRAPAPVLRGWRTSVATDRNAPEPSAGVLSRSITPGGATIRRRLIAVRPRDDTGAVRGSAALEMRTHMCRLLPIANSPQLAQGGS